MNSEIKNNKLLILTEVFNSITHGIGVLLGIFALVLLIIKANTTPQLLTYIIYASSIIILFLASTIYHSLSFTKAKNFLRRIDHSSIFILIAGTYTPYLILGINNTRSHIFTVFIWLVALVGINIKIFAFDKFKKLSTLIYLIMGWAVILIIGDLVSSIKLQALILLASGGIVYSLGTIFYKNKSLKFSHVYWHLFVLLGAILMFLSIYLYI